MDRQQHPQTPRHPPTLAQRRSSKHLLKQGRVSSPRTMERQHPGAAVRLVVVGHLQVDGAERVSEPFMARRQGAER